MASNELEIVYLFSRKHPRFAETLYESYQTFLENGHDPNEEWSDDRHGPTRSSPLFGSILDGNVQLTDLLLKFGADATKLNREGRAALHEAIVRSQKAIINLLIERETNLETPLRSEFLFGGTALHLAVSEGQTDIIERLLAEGCNPQARSESGWTPADVAVLDHQTAALEILLDRISLGGLLRLNINNDFVLDTEVGDDTALLASHLLEHGVRGSNRRHYIHYQSGLLDFVNMQKLYTVTTTELSRSLIGYMEEYLGKEAGITRHIVWQRKLCKACVDFNARNGKSLFTAFEHCPDLSSLKLSSENGCNLCQLLLEALDSHWCLLHQIDKNWIEEFGVKPHVRLRLEEKEVVPRFGSHRLIVVCGEKISFMDLNHVQRQISNVISKTLPTDTTTTGSERSLAIAKAWMQRCEEEHPTCRRIQLGKLPSRVIEVSTDSHPPRIHVSTGERIPYAALSYCWGTDQNIRLLSTNIETYMEGISADTIPKTIADALKITKAMGLSYLWVDSLCILQDSEEDLQHELSYMGGIYANAWLTIAPKNSLSCNDGCFRERNWKTSALIPLDIRLPSATIQKSSQIHFQVENKRTSCVNRLMVLPRHRMQKNGKKSVLKTRGWTLQEELLSRRMLHCSDRELSWTCLEGRCTERMPEQEDTRGRRKWKYAMKRVLVTGIEGYGNLNALKADDVFNYWLEIVENYVRRELSKTEDTLAAIQGVQDVIGNVLNDVPVAGIWRGKYLAPSLLWRASEHERKSTVVSFSCPSWSWAGLSHPVRYTQIPSGKTKKDWVWYHDVKYFVDAVSWHVNNNGLHGINGYVTLRCELIREHDMSCEKAIVRDFPNRPPRDRAGREFINMMIHPDHDEDISSDPWLNAYSNQ